jgi:hypothetical protein
MSRFLIFLIFRMFVNYLAKASLFVNIFLYNKRKHTSLEVIALRFIAEAVWDRIVSYSGAYLAGLLVFSLVYASAASGGGDNTLYLRILKTFSPYVLLSVPAAYAVAKMKGLLGPEE